MCPQAADYPVDGTVPLLTVLLSLVRILSIESLDPCHDRPIRPCRLTQTLVKSKSAVLAPTNGSTVHPHFALWPLSALAEMDSPSGG